jgi:membrane dipeptidase
MNRRAFLKRCAMVFGSIALGRWASACAGTPKPPVAGNPSIARWDIVDAHAHPNQFFTGRPRSVDESASLDSMREAGLLGACFAAVGDLESIMRGRSVPELAGTRAQLARVQAWAESGRIAMVRRGPDFTSGKRSIPAAVVAIEGGDCLEGDLANLDVFYRSGVRLITLMHYTPNDIGDIMTGTARHGGLTPFGRQVVARMQGLGLVVDAAHAHSLTLKDIASVASGPIIDSHTSPAPPVQDGLKPPARMRSWEELEWIARTGGIVCTWPLRTQYGGWQRATIEDWARETVEIKRRIGIEHVALGTDGGGGVPRRVASYDGYRDLGRLADALAAAGLSEGDIRAYMGGNFVRVFTACVG